MDELQRPASSRSIRPSKFAQTISRFKGIIRIPVRKTSTQGTQPTERVERGPYPRTSASLKPYMSQPMLCMQRSSTDTNSHPDSDMSSGSADLSPSRVNSKRVHSSDFGPPQDDSPPPPRQNTNVPISKLDPVISPPRPSAIAHPASGCAKPSSNTPRLTPLSHARPPRPIRPLPQVPSCSYPSSTTATTPATHFEPVHAFTTSSNPVALTRNSSTVVRRSTEDPIQNALSNPPLEPLLRSVSEADGQVLQQSESAPYPTNTTTETRPLKLSLPTLSRRISLLQATNGGAKLSPTILNRPMPLPIMNLPKLPTSVGAGASGEGSEMSPSQRRRSERVGLGSMPALPLQGTVRGAGGHEEPDDMEDDDEEMEDIDEEATDDDHSYVAHDNDDTTSQPGTATSGGSGFSDEGLLGRGSYDLVLPSEARRSVRPELPPLSLASPLDIRFQATSLTSGMIRGAESGSIPLSDKKGKQRQPMSSSLSFGHTNNLESSEPASRSPPPEMGIAPSRTPRPSLLVSTPRSSYHSFATASDAGYNFGPQPLAQFKSEGSDMTPSAQLSDPFLNASNSPVVTPHALSQFGNSPSAKSKSTNWDRNSAMLPAGAGTNPTTPGALLVQRPLFHKRASRSLIDLHSIETREAIGRMMQEEEEKQEKARRHMSLKRNGDINPVASGVGNAITLPPEKLGSMVEGTLPNEVETTRKTTRMQDSATKVGMARSVTGPDIAAESSKLATTGAKSVAEAAGIVGTTNGMDGGIRSSMAGGMGGEMKQQNRISMAPAYEVAMSSSHSPLQGPLRRRRSMPTYNEATSPPPYPSFAPYPFARHAQLQISPREDEGREQLPPYSNSIYLKAIMPRKMEFSEPGVQAKDRKWRRVLCVLEGTMFKVYRCPVGPGGVSAIEQWWESKVGAGDVASYPAGPGSSAASPPRAGSSRAIPNATAEVRNRHEEKVDQQYLRYPVQDELRVDGTSGLPGEDEDEHPPSRGQGSNASLVASNGHHPHPRPAQVAITKSALNLAVHFLKPGSKHVRSSSDAGPPSPSSFKPPGSAPRSSLNLPRSGTSTPNSSTIFSASRSHSPLPSASSSTLGVGHGSRSHSPLPSSRLGVPSSSSSLSSRPATPSTACSSGRSASRARNHDSPTPRPARSAASAKQDELPEPDERDLICCYTMQHAESGLGNDYMKRKNVIRVRLEGEQFLLQAKDVPSVVQWIEGLQSATNIALDLDERPMPRGPIFPRRRRRRRPVVPPITTQGAGVQAVRPTTVSETYTPTSATAGQPALRRT